MKTIEQKAQELFEKRIAPYAKNLSLKDKQNIIEFQKLIFTIDDYYEHHESIEPAILQSFWNKLQSFLNNLHIPSGTQEILLQDLKDYAEIEASTRNDKKLTDYAIGPFYLKKSCDVRLQRHLIRYLNGNPVKSTREEINRDILEEIEDDLDDLDEDRTTPFNGNRLLEALNSKNEVELHKYISFIQSLPEVPEDLVSRVLRKISLATRYSSIE